ncbi:MAG: hypothetical protein ABIP77_01545, partial [Candidatus Limnocylindrales bacterium]
KMAKSADNVLRVTELAEQGVDPLAFRYLVMTSRYGHKLNYSDASLGAASSALASLRSRLAALGPAPASGPWVAPRVVLAEPAGDRPAGVADRAGDRGPDRAHGSSAPLSEAGRGLHDRFVAAIDDDLDLPVALAVLRETLRADLSPDERRWLVLDVDAVLGLDLHRAWEGAGWGSSATEAVPADVQALVEARSATRAARDFAAADDLRRLLEAKGWSVVDSPTGSTARRIP